MMGRRIIGNRVAEKDIRDWLECKSFFGSSARFQELELHAIQRPGWVQVFRFRVEAKTAQGEWETLHGAMRDDDRYNRIEVEVFHDEDRQQKKLDEWSEGCFQTRSNRASRGETPGETWWGLVLIVVLAIVIATILGIRAMMTASTG